MLGQLDPSSQLTIDMDTSCFVENGGTRMAIGYRFRPTDEELLIHYLIPKVLSIPFPADVIPELDASQTDPWSLPGNLNEKRRHFFSNRVLDSKATTARSGFWKPVGKFKVIVAPRSNQPVGVRKTLVFRQKKRCRGAGTRWFLHEFRFLGPESTQDWAVYRLFEKKIKQKKQNGVTAKIEEQLRCEIDLRQLSCCSSGVTNEDDSLNGAALLDEEASSAYNDGFSSFS